MYSKSFDIAFAHILKSEGGYVNNKNDPGGETKYGICKRDYPDLDIKNLTEEQAKEIYYRVYWAPYAFEKMPAKIALKVFDTGINIGNKGAFKLLQQAINLCGANVTVDGAIGAKTLEAMSKCKEDAVLASYRTLQANYYKGLVEKNPKLGVFLKGWLRRAST